MLEAEQLVERRRQQNRDAQKRRREKVRLQQQAQECGFDFDIHAVASGSQLIETSNISAAGITNLASRYSANPVSFRSFPLYGDRSEASLDTLQLSARSDRWEDTLLSDTSAITSETNFSVQTSGAQTPGKGVLEVTLSYIKLADRMSKNTDQATRDKLFNAVIYETQRSKWPQSDRLPFPVSLTFEGQAFFNAILRNALYLGFTNNQLQDYDSVSDIGERWMLQSPSEDGNLSYWDSVPENMHPSALQMISEHHPFLDISFPWPHVRDRLLEATSSGIVDVDDLCVDLIIGGTGVNSEPASFLIWGSDSMDPDSWEVGEQFVQKYGFLFDPSVISRSNWWRKQRGLPPIKMSSSRIVAL